MSHLTETQIADFRDELERQLVKLEKSMTVTDEALKTVALDQGAVGRLSRIWTTTAYSSGYTQA